LYYFKVVHRDRWGNVSTASSQVSSTPRGASNVTALSLEFSAALGWTMGIDSTLQFYMAGQQVGPENLPTIAYADTVTELFDNRDNYVANLQSLHAGAFAAPALYIDQPGVYQLSFRAQIEADFSPTGDVVFYMNATTVGGVSLDGGQVEMRAPLAGWDGSAVEVSGSAVFRISKSSDGFAALLPNIFMFITAGSKTLDVTDGLLTLTQIADEY
jgi:hypothetical protein